MADEQAVVVGVEEVCFARSSRRCCCHRAFRRREELALVVAVEVNLIGLAVGAVAFEALADDVGLTRNRAQESVSSRCDSSTRLSPCPV